MCLVRRIIINIMILKSIFRKKSSDASLEFDPEAIIGEKCVVLERISAASGSGLVKVKGTMWAARPSFDDEVFESGEVVRIVAVEGVRLICRK